MMLKLARLKANKKNKKGSTMKISNISYLIAFSAIFSLFIQAAEEMVPSLAQLAAKKAVESVEVGSPLYEKLTIEAKQPILEKKGTWKEVLNFVNQYPDYVSQDLIASIPDKIWDILNISNPIQNFNDQVKKLPPSEQALLLNILKQKTESFLERFSTLTVYKSTSGHTYELPIDFFYRERMSEKYLKENYQVEPAIFEQFLIVYISQKLQEALMSSIQIDQKGNAYLSTDAYNQLRYIYDNLMGFAKQYKKRKRQQWIYAESFIEESIRDLLRDLHEGKIGAISYKEIKK